MKCIDNLFDEILEEIFKRLPSRSRLVCKEVCQRWHEILMTRKAFRKDRHIFLSPYHRCWQKDDSAQYSTFHNSQYPYESLTICNGNRPLHTLDAFWRHLGKSVKKMHYRASQQLISIYSEMPLIEELIFDANFFEAAQYIFEIFDKKGHFLPNLRKIEFRDNIMMFEEFVIHSEIMTKSVLIFKKVFSTDLQLKIRKIIIQEENVDDLDWIVKNFVIDELQMEVKDEANHFSRKLLSLEKMPEMGVNLRFGAFADPNFVYLDVLLKKHPNIKSVEIFSQFAPFPKPYTQITKLNVFSNDKLKSFKMFECLANLEHLTVVAIGSICKFGHENINLPKLKYLKHSVIDCYDCLKSIATSFPLMEEFHGIFGKADCASILGLMFKNWPELKLMKVEADNLGHFEHSVVDLEKRPNLRSLEIRIYGPQPEEDFQILGEKFPHLSKLTFYFQEITDGVGLLRSILQGIPNLRRLTLLEYSNLVDLRNGTKRETYMSKNSEEITEIILSDGQLLRQLTLEYNLHDPSNSLE